jgi:hypothetical protein
LDKSKLKVSRLISGLKSPKTPPQESSQELVSQESLSKA